MMTFSVIVPTYNRARVLQTCISSLRNQRYPRESYEIIVIDNNSTDGTKSIVDKLNQEESKQVKYLLEKRQGLMHSRHAGAWNANNEILAFIDDDSIADPLWLDALARAYIDFGADCVGGKVLIQWDQTPPNWVRPFEGLLGRLDYGPSRRVLENGEAINGSNFSILKRRLFEIGGFNPDQIGMLLVGDGEIGLCKKIHLAGWKMAWAPDAFVRHYQIVERNATIEDLKRRFYNNGVSLAYDIYRYKKPNSVGVIVCAAKQFSRSIIFKLLPLFYRLNKKESLRFGLKSHMHLCAARYFLKFITDSSLRELALREDWIQDRPS